VRYLLDTNAVIALLGNHPLVRQRVRRVSQLDIVVSALVMHELYFGAYMGVRTMETLRNYGQLRFAVLPFTLRTRNGLPKSAPTCNDAILPSAPTTSSSRARPLLAI
jgi:predicted nucleic acid-binding protein